MINETPAIEHADPIKMAEALENELYDEDHEAKKSDPSWDDVEKAAQTIGQKSEPAGEDDQDSDIEPGLLNDIEDQTEGGDDE